MNLIKYISILILTVAFCHTSAFAKEKKPGMGIIARIQNELNLSEEQANKLKELKTQSKWGTKEKRKAMEQTMQELEALMSGPASEADVRAKFSVLQKQQDEYAKARLEKILSIRAILTSEQRAKFKNYFDRK